ncbi:MAG TPA: aldo/keto reductase [Acidothermaceae bacterium]|nr:aldo/keto reductase [Acidothermaceae bacterium]
MNVPLGRGGLQVSRFGFGGAPIGGLFESVDDEQALASLTKAWDVGMRYFDTAPHYGAGTSERRTGSFLAGKPSAEWVLSTKVGRLIETDDNPPSSKNDAGFVGEVGVRRVFDFSRDGIRRSFDASLQRLGVDHVAVLFLHDPDEHWQQAIDEAWPALAGLRDEGAVRCVGAGMNQSAMLARFVRETDMDVVLLAGRYTLLDQQALDDLLPACLERRTSVVVGGVFNSGILASPDRNLTYDYGQAPREVIERAKQIADVCLQHDVALPAAAIQFPLAHPAITTELIGARSPHEVEQNARYSQAPIPAQLWDDLRAQGLLRLDAPVPVPVPQPSPDQQSVSRPS